MLSWIAGGFIIIGFMVVVSMKKEMEQRVAFIKGNAEAGDNEELSLPVVRWIWGTVTWAIVSMLLIVWWFFAYVS